MKVVKYMLLGWMLATMPLVAPLAATDGKNADRNACFGELHIHSGWSIDAYVFGTRLGSEDATRYAMVWSSTSFSRSRS